MTAPAMVSLTRRALTPGEIALARIVFRDEIDYRRVRIVQAPSLPLGAVAPLVNTIFFFSWRAARDFARAPAQEQAWFIHELAHVWQAQRGKVLAVAKLKAMGKKAYRQTPGKRGFSALNIETQAECARFAFLERIGAASPEGARYAALWPISAT